MYILCIYYIIYTIVYFSIYTSGIRDVLTFEYDVFMYCHGSYFCWYLYSFAGVFLLAIDMFISVFNFTFFFLLLLHLAP